MATVKVFNVFTDQYNRGNPAAAIELTLRQRLVLTKILHWFRTMLLGCLLV